MIRTGSSHLKRGLDPGPCRDVVHRAKVVEVGQCIAIELERLVGTVGQYCILVQLADLDIIHGIVHCLRFMRSKIKVNFDLSIDNF